MTRQNWISLIVYSIFFIIIVYVCVEKENNDLEQNSIYYCGRIDDFYIDTRGHHNILYEYTVYNKILKDITMRGNFKDCDKTGWCIGKCFEVQYSSKNPDNSTMDSDKPCDCPEELQTTKAGQY